MARIGLLSYLIPVLSTLFLALDKQPITPPTVAGMILVIGSAMLGNLGGRPPEIRAETPGFG
ncbi:MAG: hypothetical protein HYU66_01620 [Armatimonadetes bacterium]|nr:hypothetical protein [Armatimonadota bacterium]